MAMNKTIFTVLLVLLSTGALLAQGEETPVYEEENLSPQAAIATPQITPERNIVQLRDFQSVLLISLRQQFPRLPGMFSVAHSCRLPEYGPVISLTLQLPAVYFTRPLLQELEKQKQIAEQQAERWRHQIERTAELIRLKARESELTEQLQTEISAKRKAKASNAALQLELEQVRKNLRELESGPSLSSVSVSSDPNYEVDLEKMLAENYQQLLQRITSSVRDILADKAPSLADVRENERITVTAHIRESFVSSQERSIVFTLRHSDIEDYRSGKIDLNGLKEKIEIRNESRDPQ
jgi:hypothetical protein